MQSGSPARAAIIWMRKSDLEKVEFVTDGKVDWELEASLGDGIWKETPLTLLWTETMDMNTEKLKAPHDRLKCISWAEIYNISNHLVGAFCLQNICNLWNEIEYFKWWQNWPRWFWWWRIMMMTILCWCWEEWIIWWTNMANYAKSSCNRVANGLKPQLNCIVAALVHFGWDCSQCIVLHRICQCLIEMFSLHRLASVWVDEMIITILDQARHTITMCVAQT